MITLLLSVLLTFVLTGTAIVDYSKAYIAREKENRIKPSDSDYKINL